MENQSTRKNKEESIGSLLTSFATSTTAHGVSRIAESSEYRFKLSWLLVWLGVMTMFTYMIIQLFLLYASRPVSTSISISYEESLTFPAVTVCNLNMVKKSNAKGLMKSNVPIMEINRNQTDLKKQFFGGSLKSTTVNMTDLEVDSVADTLTGLITDINNLKLQTRQSIGYQSEEFLIYCTWAGLMCGYSSYFAARYWKRSWNWKYGNCFTFNGYTSINGQTVEPLVSSASEGSDGLTLTLDINRTEYLPGLAMEEGIRILIGDQDEPLYPVERGISIEPGISASISIRKSIIEREDSYGNGSCRTGSIGAFKYSGQDCISTCKAKKQRETCNCTDAQYFGRTDSKICDDNYEKLCVMMVNSNFSRKLFDCSASCPPPCKSTVFQKTITQSKIFPAGYLAVHSKKPMTERYVEQNIIQLSIFFEDQTVQQVSSGVYYKFDNLISDIGGQLGLWIGVSAVTCMEFIAFVWSIILYLTNKRKKRNSLQSQ